MGHKRKLKGADGIVILPFTTNVPVAANGGLQWVSGGSANYDSLGVKIALSGGLATGPDGLYVIGGGGGSGSGGVIPTISVGSTTTLSAGSSAYVTSRPVTGGVILDFGIPKGSDGLPGSSISGLIQLTVPEDISGEWYLHLDIADNIDFENDDGMARHAASHDFRTSVNKTFCVYDGEFWETLVRSVRQSNAGMPVIVDLQAVFGDLTQYMTDVDGNGMRGLVRYYWVDADSGTPLSDAQCLLLGASPGASNPVGMAANKVVNIVAQSGAVFTNRPFSTIVGGYTVELTSNGGFSVHGFGASATLSGGSVAVSAYQGVNLTYENEDEGMVAHVTAGFGGVNIDYNDTEYETTLKIGGQGVTANGSAITQATSEFAGTSLGIDELTGGVKYVCSSALSALSIGSAAPGCNATIFFTVASGAIVTPPANVPYFGATSYTAGSSYLMMVNGDAAVCNEAAIVPGV